MKNFGSIIIWFIINAVAFYGLYEGWDKLHVIGIIIGGGFIAIIFNAILISKRKNELREGVDFADAVSRGDLSKQLYSASEDEIGRLSDSLNKMVVNLKFMVNRVKSAFNEMRILVDKTFKTGEMVTDSTKKQANIINNTVVTLRDLSSAIREITRNSTAVNVIISDTLKSTEGSVESVNTMLNNLRELESSSREIEDIVDIINDISEQTNILALNAAVESTRVQESGYGAGSISSEIRKLAERSRDAAGNVDRLISTNVEKIKLVLSSANQVDFSLKNTSQNINKVNNFVSSIKNISSDESEISENLIKLIESINDLNSTSLNFINELVNSTNVLLSQTDGLKNMISKFRLGE